MTDRWTRANELFLAVLEMPEEEREATLEEICDSQALKRDVKNLLIAHSEAGEFMEGVAAGDLPSIGHLIGARIGSYRVVSEIGRGGMAAVFLAERSDGTFQQRVAIKFLLSPIPSKFMMNRFRLEQQVLAGLDHPNIARLLDGGFTREGHPYLVMEYVEGLPIDIFCEKKRLSRHDRLTLFRKICDAVHYIHQNLVVHRDLKPDNILITPQGEPKVLDFGIAKLLNMEVARAIGITQATGRPMMTPEFASPEQVRNGSMTTASDIYSLGVLLYRLLTGSKPYQLTDRSPAGIERIICEQEPPRPSKIALQQTGEDESLRLGSPRRGMKKMRIPFDLDCIVLKAMRKDPRSRYASAQALGEDIALFAAGFPVKARKGRWGYRAAKFFARHRATVSIASFMVLMLLVSLAVLVRQQRKTMRERDISNRLSQFMVGVFENSDPLHPTGDNPTARALMDRASRKIDRELGGEPLVRAALLSSLGKVNMHLGDLDRAGVMLREALTLQSQRLPSHDPAVLRTTFNLARLYLFTKDLDSVAALLIPGLRQAKAVHGEGHALTAEANLLMGRLKSAKSLYREAKPFLQRAASIMAATAEPLANAEICGELGQIDYWLGAFDEAMFQFEKALDYSVQALGNDHPLVAKAMNNLAGMYAEQGEMGKAIGYMEKGRRIAEKNFGDQHPYVAMSCHNLGLAYCELGNHEKGIELLRKALKIRTNALGEQHPDVAATKVALARRIFVTGETSEPLKQLEESLKIYAANYEPGHLAFAKTKLLMAEIMVHMGNHRMAERQLDACEPALVGELEPGHPDLVQANKLRLKIESLKKPAQ